MLVDGAGVCVGFIEASVIGNKTEMKMYNKYTTCSRLPKGHVLYLALRQCLPKLLPHSQVFPGQLDGGMGGTQGAGG